MIGVYHGAYGAPNIARLERKLAKYQGKVAAGQRCGFPPSKAACERKAQKFSDLVDQARAQQLALDDVLSATDPNAAAQAVSDAAAANLAAAQEASSSTPYIAGGVILLGALAAAAAFAFGGK